MELHLEKLTYKNWHDVEKLRVRKDQREFMADTVGSLALAYVIREEGFRVFTFGIYKGEKPVGFAMIGYDIPFDDDDKADEKYWFTRSSYFVWRFMIDRRYQGRGYGKEAFGLLLDFIRTAPCRNAEHVWICYNKNNAVAKKLYASFGFEEIPEICDDDKNEVAAVLKLQ